MTRSEGQAGWVLHRRPWRESSLLIEFFGYEQGRVGLVARAARAARSPWRGLAEPFCPLVASWSRRGEMGTLTALEVADDRRQLIGRALWCGLYANELLLRLLVRDDPVPTVFDAYDRLLSALAAGQSQPTSVRLFELALLEGLGVAPQLHCESDSGDPIRSGALYHLDPEAGFKCADRPGPDVFEGEVVLALSSGDLDDPPLARAARQLTRLLIDHQLQGRPLQTRRLLENLTRESGAQSR